MGFAFGCVIVWCVDWVWVFVFVLVCGICGFVCACDFVAYLGVG